MRRFVMRRLALFDWIHNLQPHDQQIAQEIYKLLERIRLYEKIPYSSSLILILVPFLHEPHSIKTRTATIECLAIGIALYGLSVLTLWFCVFRPLKRKCVNRFQAMLYQMEYRRILDALIPLDTELAEETQNLLRPPPPKRSRRANRLHG